MYSQHFRLRFTRKNAAKLLLLNIFLLGAAVSCRTSQDAQTAATRLTATAEDLHLYYVSLSKVVEQHEKLERLQNALLGVPLDQQDLDQLKTAHEEIEKRAEIAKSLADLAQAYSELTNSQAAEKVALSAENLGSALSGIKQLPGSSHAPEALKRAGNLLVTLAQKHDQRKMAQAMDPTITGLSEMFSEEKPVYGSIHRTYIGLAQSLALELVRRHQIDARSLLLPALRPFGLPPGESGENLSPGLQAYAQQQIQERGQSEIAAHNAASTYLDEALKEAAKQIHALASGEHLPPAPPQPYKSSVERWTAMLSEKE
ncbi:MAG TPA: hypothetical protein VFA02_09945 [Pseudacidobacterium sp.]|nr:hypothetical protein [Pseudacidobacterium sp.]